MPVGGHDESHTSTEILGRWSAVDAHAHHVVFRFRATGRQLFTTAHP